MELAQLRILALGIVISTSALAVVAVVLADGSDLAVPGSIGLVVAALVTWAAIGWLRQRPIAPGDTKTYGSNATLKIAVAEVPGLLGFGLAVGPGPGSLAWLGLAATLVALALAWPSEADRERHQLLYLV